MTPEEATAYKDANIKRKKDLEKITAEYERLTHEFNEAVDAFKKATQNKPSSLAEFMLDKSKERVPKFYEWCTTQWQSIHAETFNQAQRLHNLETEYTSLLAEAKKLAEERSMEKE